MRLLVRFLRGTIFLWTLTAYLYEGFHTYILSFSRPVRYGERSRYAYARHLQMGHRALHSGDKCHSRIFLAGRTRSTLSGGASS